MTTDYNVTGDESVTGTSQAREEMMVVRGAAQRYDGASGLDWIASDQANLKRESRTLNSIASEPANQVRQTGDQLPGLFFKRLK
jgi:hypothetical protein